MESWKASLRSCADQLRFLLVEGHERRVWEVLGYATWADCLEALAKECTADLGKVEMADFCNAFRNERMGRPRQYASNADRQRAYRLRVKDRSRVEGKFPLLSAIRSCRWSTAELKWLTPRSARNHSFARRSEIGGDAWSGRCNGCMST